MTLVIILTLLVFGAAALAVVKFRPRRDAKVKRGYADDTDAELLAVVAEAKTAGPKHAAEPVEAKPHEFVPRVKAPNIPTI